MPEETSRSHHPVLIFVACALVIVLIGVVAYRQYQASLSPKATNLEEMYLQYGKIEPSSTNVESLVSEYGKTTASKTDLDALVEQYGKPVQ